MITSFERAPVLEPESGDHYQWRSALGAGLIAGLILLVIPRGSPWAGVTFFSAVIMGRAVPPGVVLSLPLVWLIHLVLAEVYGLIISRFLTSVTQGRAILTGAVIGLVLYLVNWGVVTWFVPAWRGNEAAVLITHLVFGLIVGGAYRGLLRRKAAPASPR